MRWSECRVVAFDTETTGLNAFAGDRVIEFGAVEIELDADGRVSNTKAHNFLINPLMPIPRTASRISGITDEDVAGQPTFGKLAPQIRALLADAILVAHNLAFDLGFVRQELRGAGLQWPATRAEVDTLPLSQRLLSELRSHKLENICHHLGVPLDNAHRASHDAEATGRVLAEIARRHGAPADLEGFVRWADAVGPPPDSGHLVVGEQGLAEFTGGPHAGQTVEDHPDYLQWMIIAVERRGDHWQPRFPDSVREWARRWLRVRCSGRFRGSPRSQGSSDWTIAPAVWA